MFNIHIVVFVGGEKALFGNKSLCVEKIPKTSINYVFKIYDEDHDHRRILFGYKHVTLLDCYLHRRGLICRNVMI